MAQVNGYQPPAGYRAIPLNLNGGLVAISPSGKMAIARGRFGGGGTITLYDRVKRQGRQITATFQQSQWQFFGGLAWQDDNTLLFGENGDLDTIFRLDTQTGVHQPLAPSGSLTDVAELLQVGNEIFALTAGGPGVNRLYHVRGGTASLLLDGYGTGYGAGLGYANNRLYLGDTNDPDFMGNPGQIWRYELMFQNGNVTGVQFVDTLSLSGGNGAALVSFAIDSEGDLIGSTQHTLTHLRNSHASPFGQFSGAFPFPTSLAYTGSRFEPFEGDGLLVVDGAFTGVGGLFAVTPVPEPGTLLILSAGLFGLKIRRRK